MRSLWKGNFVCLNLKLLLKKIAIYKNKAFVLKRDNTITPELAYLDLSLKVLGGVRKELGSYCVLLNLKGVGFSLKAGSFIVNKVLGMRIHFDKKKKKNKK